MTNPAHLPAACAGRPLLQLLVLAKEPVAGRVKTRLSPPYSSAQAASLAAAALADTLAAVAGAPAHRHVLVATGDLRAPGFDRIDQRGDGLDERLAAAYDDAYADCPVPMLLIGMDTPQITTALLAEAGAELLRDGVDAVLGPAADGGWWALGLRRPDPRLLLGVPMSTSSTGAHQRARLSTAGLRVAELPVLVDVDDAGTAREVALVAPLTRFAAAVRGLTLAMPA